MSQQPQFDHSLMDDPNAADRNYSDRNLSLAKLVGFTVSMVFTLGILVWCFSRSMSVLNDGDAGIDATQVSNGGYGSTSRNQQIAELRERARAMDDQLLSQRRERRERDSNQPRRSTQEIYESWKREVENLESQLKGKRVEPGTFSWDVRTRLEELKSDPPLSEEQLRELED